MKKTIMSLMGAMMILSLAACTPTTEQSRGGQETVMETTKDTGPGVVEDRPVDPGPDPEVVALYTLDEGNTKVVGTMEITETLDAQALIDLLIQYQVLEEGTTAVSFEAEGEAASEAVGPGVVKIPGFETPAPKEYGTLVLNQFPQDSHKELRVQAVVDTITENLDVLYLTIKVDDEIIIENAAGSQTPVQ